MTEESSLRPWRDIAKELGQETNAERILELCDELTAAMRAQQGKKIELAIPSAIQHFKPKPNGE